MKRLLFSGFLILLFNGAVFLGAAPLTLSLDEAVRRALDQSIDLQKGSLDLAAAGFAAQHLWAELFPSITAGAGVEYRTGLAGGAGFQVDKNNLAFTTSLGITLSMNAGLPKTMRLLELAYRTQLLNYENARRQLEIQVTKTFFSLITGREKLAHLEKIHEAAEMQREKTRISFENGLTGELTYLRSRLSVETARLNLNRERASYAAQLREFLALLGMGQGGEVELEGAVTIAAVEAEAERLIPEYLAKRPDMAAQRQVIERIETERSQTLLSARAPSLSLSARWNGNFGNLSGSFSDTLTGGLTLSIPLDGWIPGTKTDQRIRSADTALEKARLELKNLENRAMNDIRSLAANLHNSWGTVEISRLQVQLAERTYELTDQGFRQGTVEYLTLEETRNSMSDARQQLLTNELAYQNMILDLAAALNIDWKDLMRSAP